jgi:O-antigen ligase
LSVEKKKRMTDNKIKNIIYSVFSFESVFVLFLFAGKYKNDPRFDWVPVDLTALFLLVSVVGGAWVFHKRGGTLRRPVLRLTGLFGLFLAYVALSYWWTPSNVYAFEKVGYLTILTFWPFLACAVIIGYRTERFQRFVVVLTILSVWFSLEAILAFVSSTIRGQQIEALGITYLGLGRVIGPAAIVLLVYGTAVETRKWLRFLSVLLLGGFMIVLLLLGGRGPLLAAVLPVGLLFYYGLELNLYRATVRVRRYVWPILLLVVAGGIAAVTFGSSEVLTTIKRFIILFESLGDSAEVRIRMYWDALRIWAENPVFGGGVGSWPVLAGFGDRKMYPHNMILEVLAEFGIFGLCLFAMPFVYAFRYLHRTADLEQDPWALLGLMLFANALINSMFTGDLPLNRYVFAFLGFLVARREKERYRSEHRVG